MSDVSAMLVDTTHLRPVEGSNTSRCFCGGSEEYSGRQSSFFKSSRLACGAGGGGPCEKTKQGACEKSARGGDSKGVLCCHPCGTREATSAPHACKRFAGLRFAREKYRKELNSLLISLPPF